VLWYNVRWYVLLLLSKLDKYTNKNHKRQIEKARGISKKLWGNRIGNECTGETSIKQTPPLMKAVLPIKDKKGHEHRAMRDE
jgi:hypothetical protein